jgi:hypothetical protein
VFFNAYWLRDKNPDPGETAPKEHELICLHSYKKRGYRPKPPLEPLPKKCKVRTADKKKLSDEEKKEKGEEDEDETWWERALTF